MTPTPKAQAVIDMHTGKPKPVTPKKPDGVYLELVPASSIVMRPVHFLWAGRVVDHELNVAFGPGKRGKGQFAAALAAHVTGGPRLPGAGREFEPGRVVWMGAEGAIDRVVVPRLMAAGADLSRVSFIRARKRKGEKEFECLTQIGRDGEELERITKGVALFILDPFMAFVDSDVDTNQDSKIRQMTSRLSAIAQRNGVCVLAIAHARKGEGPANQKLGGSVGLYNAARSVLVLERLPKDPEVRVLAVADGNNSRPARALTYTFEDAEVKEPTTGEMIRTSRIVWGDECDLSADEILAGPVAERGGAGRPPEALETAREWLSLRLAMGPAPESEISREAANRRISDSTLRRAKKVLDICSGPELEEGKRRPHARSFWWLPSASSEILTKCHLWAPKAPESGAEALSQKVLTKCPPEALGQNSFQAPDATQDRS